MALKLLLLPRAIYQLILICALLVISALAISQPAYQQLLSNSDKTAHFSAFFVLSFLTQLALPLRWYWQVLLLAGYGALIEVAQMSHPARHASWEDFGVDLLAIACYFLLLWIPVDRLRARKA